MAVHYWSVVYLSSYNWWPRLLQLEIPTLKSHAATRHVTTRTCPLWTNISRRSSYFLSLLLIAFRFRAICVVVEFHSSHSFRHFAANKLLIFVFFREIWQVLTSYGSSFASFRACCVVVEFHSSHSFAIFQWSFSSFSYFSRKFDRFRVRK